jgi:hypothetical protein
MDASFLPVRRSEDLAVEEVDGSTLVYDHRDDTVSCLDTTAHTVWLACDGTADLAALAETTGIATDDVTQALIALDAHGLLEAPEGTTGLTRRQFGARAAVAAATAAGAAMVWSIAAPTVAAAASSSTTQPTDPTEPT